MSPSFVSGQIARPSPGPGQTSANGREAVAAKTDRYAGMASLGGQHAYTLVELLCVISLLAMIVLIAMPALQGLEERRNLEIAARNLATDMRKTQQAAITRGHTFRIEFQSDDKQYRIRNTITEEVTRIRLPEGIEYCYITIEPIGGFRTSGFYYNGVPIHAGTVGFCNSSGDKLFVILAPVTGRVRISDTPPWPDPIPGLRGRGCIH